MNAFLAKYMGYIISFFCSLCGNNFAVAIFLFTLFINIVFCPINIKQQKTAANQARIKFKLEKLKEKHADDQAKFQQESAKLYQDAGASPFSGCLLLLVRMPFFFGIYYAIQQPLSYIIHADASLIQEAGKALSLDMSTRGAELSIINGISKLDGFETLKELIGDFNLSFFGIDLTATPKFSWNFGEAFASGSWLLWIIPLLSFATSMLSSIITTQLQKINNPDAPRMGGLMLMMPLISLWIAFTVPGAVGFYWACSNFVAMLLQIALQILYNPARVIACTEAKEARARRAAEQEKIRAVDGKTPDSPC